MISRTDRQLSSKQQVMRCFPGASLEDNLLLQKVREIVALQVGTNNYVKEPSNNVLNKILNLKQFIKKSLPDNNIIILIIIERLDNGKAALAALIVTLAKKA